jgi:hypothetical protein
MMLRAALAYATRLGWPVFPLQTRGKFPMVPKSAGGNGHLDATTNTNQIEAWWRRWPRANIGIACDERSGLLALDVDPRNGGDEELAALELEHGRLPDTIVGLTGGGGVHYIFQRPAGLTFRGKLCDGVDVKSSGYIVVPPSVHPSGTPYRWEASSRPLETELAELPAWVLRRIIRLEPEIETTGNAADSFLALAFHHAGWLGKRIDDRRINCHCPWENEHSQKSGSGGTVIFAPNEESPNGLFWCSHSSHGTKTQDDVLAELPAEAIREAAADVVHLAAARAYEADERAAIESM